MTQEPDSKLERELWLVLQDAGIPQPLLQFRPVPARRWRVDFCWLAERVIVEVEGGLYQAESGHRSYTGVVRDIEKYNCFCREGWRVIRVTAAMIANGEAVDLIRECLKTRAIPVSALPVGWETEVLDA